MSDEVEERNDSERVIGYCPRCQEQREADAVDVLFDLRLSCGTCGEWLEITDEAKPL